MDTRGHIYYEGLLVTDDAIVALLTDMRARLPGGFARDFHLLLPPAFETWDDMSYINRAVELALRMQPLGVRMHCGG